MILFSTDPSVSMDSWKEDDFEIVKPEHASARQCVERVEESDLTIAYKGDDR